MLSARLLLWKLAFRGLLRHSRRNIASALAIALGFSGVVLMGGYIERVDRYLGANTIFSNYTGHVAVFRKGYAALRISSSPHEMLSANDVSRIRELVQSDPTVEFTAKVLRGSGLLATGCRSMPFVATGIERSQLPKIEQNDQVKRWTPELMLAKRGFRLSEVTTIESPLSVSTLLAPMLDKPLVAAETAGAVSPVATDCTDLQSRKAIAASAEIQMVSRSIEGDFSAVDAQIVGHHTTGMAFSDETSVLAPYEVLANLLVTDSVSYLAIYLRPEAKVPDFVQSLQQKIDAANIPAEAVAYSAESVGAFYHGVMRFLMTMASFFLALVSAMVCVTIVNFVTVGLLERTREIGTLRAIGFDLREIRSLFFRETALLTGAGLLVGMIVSVAVAIALEHVNIRFSPPGIAGDMQFLLLLTFRLCAGVGIAVSAVAFASAWWRLRTVGKQIIAEQLSS